MFVKRVIDSAKKLEACLEKRREELGNSLPSSLEGPIADNDNKQSMAALAEAGPEWGVEAALALAYFSTEPTEIEKEQHVYHIKSIKTEILSLERTALSAELMSRVMPEHQKLLNLAGNKFVKK